MISCFSKGMKAASLGLDSSLCRLEGADRDEWMNGYKAYKPTKTDIFSVDEISEDFARKHFKTE